MTHAQPDPGPYDHEAQAAFVDEPASPDSVEMKAPPAEPVAAASAVQVLIGAGVTAGWFVATDPVIPVLLSVAGAAAAVYTWLTARGWVKPWPRPAQR